MKGLAWQTALPLVLLVIAAAVVIPLVTKLTASTKGICEMFSNCDTLSAIELGDDLEKAIKCTALRCSKGCNDPATTSITWFDGAASCSQFCQKEFQEDIKTPTNPDGKGKICNERAKAHPVVFIPAEAVGTIIQADDLKDTIQCLAPVPNDACGSIGFTKRLQSTSGRPVLYLDANLFRSQPENVGTGILHPACVGKLELVKAGEVSLTVASLFIAPEYAAVKLTAKTAQTATKLEKIRRAYTLGKVGTAGATAGTGSAYAELFWQQVKIIKSADLNPGVVYIWANDLGRGIVGKFSNAISIVAGLSSGTQDHLILCSQPPATCQGTAVACEKRENKEDACKAGDGCDWKNNECVPSGNVTSCQYIFSESKCLSQPGCCWGRVCEPFTIGRLSKVFGIYETHPQYSELQAFVNAVNDVGGENEAMRIWGDGLIINKIEDLFDFPEFASLEKWSDFAFCPNKVLPGGCSSIQGKPLYCSVKNKQSSFINYPFECGCQVGEGTKINGGEKDTGRCEKFDAASIKEIRLENSVVDIETLKGNVKANGIDYQLVTAALLDGNGVVVTGINPDDVKFEASIGAFDVISCEPSGRARYYSCSARILSEKAGESIVTFEYKPMKLVGKITVEFIEPK